MFSHLFNASVLFPVSPSFFVLTSFAEVLVSGRGGQIYDVSGDAVDAVKAIIYETPTD
jgi:hypothetical protein